MNSIRLFVINFITCLLPPSRLYGFKRQLLRWAGANVGNNVRCVSSAKFQTTGELSIGNDTFIGHEVLIVGGNAKITIGSYCDIAPRVTIATGSHKINPDGPHVAGDGYSQTIFVGDGCWVCTGAVLLGGTEIGERSIVAAGAVVRGVFPAGSLIGGVPAITIKNLLNVSSNKALI